MMIYGVTTGVDVFNGLGGAVVSYLPHDKSNH